MNRKDSLKHFYADQVEPERVRLMEDLRRTLESRSTELTAEYMEHFREFIKEVALAQEVRTKGNRLHPVLYIANGSTGWGDECAG